MENTFSPLLAFCSISSFDIPHSLAPFISMLYNISTTFSETKGMDQEKTSMLSGSTNGCYV